MDFCALVVSCVHAQLLQSCPTPCKPLEYSLPGSSLHGILQAGILEWVAISSRDLPTRDLSTALISPLSCIGRQILYHECHLGSPAVLYSPQIKIPSSSNFIIR